MVNKNDVLLLNGIKKKKYLSPSVSVCGTLMKEKMLAGASAGGSDKPFIDGSDYNGELAKERFYSDDFFSGDSYGDYE